MKRWLRGELTLELQRRPEELRLCWLGRSTEPEPEAFLAPVLAEAFRSAREAGAPLVLDFAALEHMSSSTLTPVVKALDDSRRLEVPVVVEYSLARKWQAVSFSALRSFETPDGRVKVSGK